jgi:diacylglycerol O-acyltransferase
MSALDGSFLRLESSSAHMHVGWSAVFAPPAEGPRPTLDALCERVAHRLQDVAWCRWRLDNAPLGISEPRWVQDHHFDLSSHVLALSEPEEQVSHDRFAAMRDGLLSQPLDRSRPLWQIFLVPRLEDGRVGMIGKIHHALVDGIAALQIVGLVADVEPGANSNGSPRWRPATGRGPLGWVIDETANSALDGARLLRAGVGMATHPRTGARKLLRGGSRALRAAREDILPRAPASPLNVSIGARRRLVGYHASRAEVQAARSGGGTHNDIGLATVAGALRALTHRHGDPPAAPLKTMVPVSMRRADETGPGNRIAMVYIQLPVHLASPQERLDSVREQTRRLKDGGRAQGVETLFRAGGLLPAPLRSPVTRALASPRVFNLTVSQSPGPRGTLHMLGCELQEPYSVVPIAQRHALAIGMVRYRGELFFGCYADPDALPVVGELPALLEAEIYALAEAPRAPRPRPSDQARPVGAR